MLWKIMSISSYKLYQKMEICSVQSNVDIEKSLAKGRALILSDPNDNVLIH